MDIAKRIKATRLALQLNQTEFAALIGATSQDMYRWETGRNVPNVATLIKMAGAGNVTVDWMLCGDMRESEATK